MSDERATIWVCIACGKTAEDPYQFRDVSCFMNKQECYTDSLKYDEYGRVTHADAVQR